MKYKLDKKIIKKIRESNNETIELEITDNNIKLVEDDEEWSIGNIYYYALFNPGPMCHGVASSSIKHQEYLKIIKKEVSFKRFHTEKEAQEYADWLDVRVVIEGVIDELGRPTREEINDKETYLYFIYLHSGEDLREESYYYGYEQPFLCKTSFLNELMKKLGEEKVIFFYKNLWRFL